MTKYRLEIPEIVQNLPSKAMKTLHPWFSMGQRRKPNATKEILLRESRFARVESQNAPKINFPPRHGPKSQQNEGCRVKKE